MATVKLYFDEMMPRRVTQQLIKSSYDVIMAVDVGMVKKDDMTEHLTYATQQGRVLVTLDRPFAGRASKRSDHAGLLCWTGSIHDLGGMLRQLSEFIDQHDAETCAGKVFWRK